ncbi:hypothetical protein C2S53_001256 [Perilla frutescens var. hirtella]|uniref:Uncharacterized protein n=1 Tax=Perilla frutescens var. hirtella TaxID=608512 RepID=A0AAD4JLU9_PERFH|nr:hypothetical protein C2S53_001256 [Perilla frutescens var. hirtella]
MPPTEGGDTRTVAARHHRMPQCWRTLPRRRRRKVPPPNVTQKPPEIRHRQPLQPGADRTTMKGTRAARTCNNEKSYRAKEGMSGSRAKGNNEKGDRAKKGRLDSGAKETKLKQPEREDRKRSQ